MPPRTFIDAIRETLADEMAPLECGPPRHVTNRQASDVVGKRR